jgi:deoxyribodipyrimidine photo-lyase
MTPIQLVWFKRDLRVYDHAPLTQAARLGPVLPLYIAEPGLWSQADAAARHWAFITESLDELTRDLTALGQPLVIRVGEATSVLTDLLDRLPIAALWSHEETGNGWTYERDKSVGRVLRAQGVPWHELPPTGVVRRLLSRDCWSRIWEERMGTPLLPPPRLQPLAGPAARESLGRIPEAGDLGLAPDPCPGRQRGGRRQAESLLEGFLLARGQRYNKELSSPVTAFEACSRLSTHLAYGTLSMRELVQATRLRRAQVADLPTGTDPEVSPLKCSYNQ